MNRENWKQLISAMGAIGGSALIVWFVITEYRDLQRTGIFMPPSTYLRFGFIGLCTLLFALDFFASRRKERAERLDQKGQGKQAERSNKDS
jgi:hypothetical protein